MLKDNLGLRIFALFLAIILWLQSILVSEQRSVVDLPLSLRSLPAGITLENIPESISFNVRGKGLEIIRMLMAKPMVFIDASMVTANTDQIPLQDYIINIPENVNVSFLGPSDTEQLNIQADVFHQKDVPIRLDFANPYIHSRFSDLNYRMNPETITVFGPRSRLQSISMIHTEVIDQEILGAGRAELKLVIPAEDISLSQERITLSISGVQEETKVFTDIALPQGYVPSRVAVRLQASAPVLANLRAQDISATVMDTADDSGLYPILIIVPENVQVIAVTPDRVRIRQ